MTGGVLLVVVGLAFVLGGRLGMWTERRHVARQFAGIVLPGWFCRTCDTFNGAAKETLSQCRRCGCTQ